MTKQRIHRPRGPKLLDLPGIWLDNHAQCAIAALKRLLETKLPTLMTVAVIGISLALPAALFVLTENLRTMAGNWEQGAAVSLFLRYEINDSAANTVAERLRKWPEIQTVQVISREKALAEFRALGGFEDALAQLKTNPLPVLLTISPTADHSSSERMEALQTKLLKLPEADFARMDSLWLERFQAILDLVQRAILVLGGLLGIGVLMIVGNTIRLEILNRRHEIEIMELVGATAGFIRRPFLYTGVWFGLLGGASAWLLVGLAVLLLQEPVSRLASLYRSDFPLVGLGFSATGAIFGGSMLLGLIGSWIAVNRHLRGADPD